MPTICVDTPLIGSGRPITVSSPPKSLCHVREEIVATAVAPGTESAAVKSRPRIGATPMTFNSSGVTSAEFTRRGRSGTPRFTAPGR